MLLLSAFPHLTNSWRTHVSVQALFLASIFIGSVTPYCPVSLTLVRTVKSSAKRAEGYISMPLPEHLLTLNSCDRSSDVYAFGTVWYELLTGEWPWRQQHPESIIWQAGRGIKPTLANLQVLRLNLLTGLSGKQANLPHS